MNTGEASDLLKNHAGVISTLLSLQQGFDFAIPKDEATEHALPLFTSAGSELLSKSIIQWSLVAGPTCMMGAVRHDV